MNRLGFLCEGEGEGPRALVGKGEGDVLVTYSLHIK